MVAGLHLLHDDMVLKSPRLFLLQDLWHSAPGDARSTVMLFAEELVTDFRSSAGQIFDSKLDIPEGIPFLEDESSFL